MRTKFVVFSDLHLHQWRYGSSIIRGRNSRLLFQQAAVLQLFSFAQEEDVTDIVFCGDFFHTHGFVSAEVLQAAWELFRDNVFSVSLLTGNHDIADKNRTVSSTRMLDLAVKRFANEFNLSHFDYHQSNPLCMIPYHETKEGLERDLAKVSDVERNVLFMHQGVSNIPVNSKGFTINEIMSADMVPESTDLAFAGHYHSHKQVSDKLWIPGSLTQLTWADEGETRGWVYVTETDNGYKVEHIASSAPTFVKKKSSDSFEDVKGKFLMVECPAGTNVAALKEEIARHHPLSIEIKIDKEKPITVETPKTFSTIMDLFHEYIETNNFTPEFIKVGKDIINASS